MPTVSPGMAWSAPWSTSRSAGGDSRGAPGVAAGRYPSPTGMGITRASRDPGSGPRGSGSWAMMVVSFLSRGAGGRGWRDGRPRYVCGSVLHHGLIDVAVVNLDSDALSAELTRDLLGDRNSPVTPAPACDVHTGEHGLNLQGVHGGERSDTVHVERDDAIRPGGFQDVGPNLRV